MAADLKTVLFKLDDRTYALHLDNVERIIHAVEITPLPKAPEIVLGIINLHGEVIPVVNIRKRFSLPEKRLSIHDQIIVVNVQGRKMAFIADSAPGYKEIPTGKIVQDKKIWNGIEYIDGVVELSGDLVLINNLNKFLLLEEEKQIDSALKDAKSEQK
ncbi:MAG: chemotaxis protein CheW [Bacteroidota bacterium]|nr:chemotaxis protein CheW [Bacteroidota bacterium]MDP4191396.1 chemotaxis protein CheW [Bacteroidota bacterium]MDP4196883.1 chemotaxis protein CheW [Bacteroidota bacterium]